MPYVRLSNSRSFCRYITPLSVWLHAKFLVFRELFLKQVKAYAVCSGRELDELKRIETQPEYETMYLDYAELLTGLIKALEDYGAVTVSDFDFVLSQYLSEVEHELVHRVLIPIDAAVRHLMRYEILLTQFLSSLQLIGQFPIKDDIVVSQAKNGRSFVLYVSAPRNDGFRAFKERC